MKIEEALKDNGKATREDNRNHYAQKDASGTLKWVGIKIKEYVATVSLESILGDDWKSYHEAKEIGPEKAGELWATGDIHYMTQKIGDELRMIPRSYDMQILEEIDHFIHGIGCYKRLYPPVEEDVERIEIDSVFFKGYEGFSSDRATELMFLGCALDTEVYAKLKRMDHSTPMKMILKTPKT